MTDDPDFAWRIVSRTPVHDYRIFRSLAVVAAHPQTGAERTFTVLETGDWINIIAITPDEQIVLLRQFRHGAERVHVEIPGMVDPGEDHETAARRELLEETGYTAPRWHNLGSVSPNPAIEGNRLHTWLAEDAVRTAEPTPDAGEVLAVYTASRAEVTAMLRDGRIDHALVVVAFAHLALRHRDPLRPDGTPAPTP